jgi:hypothetical protein
MITIKLQGGLGNQMFQYAFGRSLSLKTGVAMAIDIIALNNGEGVTRRRYALDGFTIAPRILSARESIRFQLEKKHPLVARWCKRLGMTVPFYCSQRQPTDLITIPDMYTSHDTYFVGLWQREEYFIDHAETVRKDFAPQKPLSATTTELARRIHEQESLAIHIRRGDYASNPKAQKVLWLSDMDYFTRAFEYVKKVTAIRTVFIFSDDIEWCKMMLNFDLPMVFVPQVGIPDTESIHLISLCSHAIISNSSFSWWGAWLNPNPHKVIVAPKKWFKKDGDSTVITPPSWIRI